MKIPSMILSANSLSEVALQQHPEVEAARAPMISAKDARDRAAARAARIRVLLHPQRFASDAPATADEYFDAQVHAPTAEAEVADAERKLMVAKRSYEKTVEATRTALLAARVAERRRLIVEVDHQVEPLLQAVAALLAHDAKTEMLTERRPSPSGWGDLPARVEFWRQWMKDEDLLD